MREIDPIEGRLVDDSPEPAYYVSTPSRGRKLAHWFFTSGAFVFVAMTVIGLACFIWRLPALTAVLGATAGWFAGWYTAKAALKQDGEIPPL